VTGVSRRILECALTAVLALLAVSAFAGLDARGAAHRLLAAGPWLLLALVPFPLAILFDAYGVRALFAALGRAVPLAGQARARIAAEAIHLSLPGGAVLADGANAWWLARRGIPMSEAAVVTGVRRGLVMRAHAAYIVVASVLGSATLARIAIGAFGTPWPAVLVLVGAAAPLALSFALFGAFQGDACARLHAAAARVAARLPAAVARPALVWLAARAAAFRAADGAVRRFARVPAPAMFEAAVFFFAAWLCESAESYVIVRLAHAPASLGFVEVMAFEAGLSLVRSAAPFAPSGLGLLDLGYVAVFRILGIPDAEVVAPAFVMLKRAKELVWILVGYAALLAHRARPGPARKALVPAPVPIRAAPFVGPGSALHLPPPA
jgi:hypothetical protein